MEFTNAELSNELFPQFRSMKDTMKAVMELGKSELSKKGYEGLETIEYTQTYGDMIDGFHTSISGYGLIQEKRLENPTVKKKFFGLIKRIITHSEEELAYTNIRSGIINIKKNDKELYNCFNQIAQKTQGERSINKVRVSLDF